MIERLQFELTKLSNGIPCYQSFWPLDFTLVYIQVPRGTAHNTGLVAPGTYHFLEHLCCDRNKVYPELNSFDRAVGMTGGGSNAGTKSFTTGYHISVPNSHLPRLLEGLFSRTFDPIFKEEDIRKQGDIVANERMRKARWWPGRNEPGWFELTQWKNDMRFSIEQVFGSDADLASMSPDSLREAHKGYFNEGVMVIAIGPGDLQPLYRRLEAIRLNQQEAPTQLNLVSWADKSYRVKHFRDVSRYELTIGGLIVPPPDLQTTRQLRFILGYLTNHTHGAFHKWLREDKGWSYGVGFGVADDQYEVDWSLDLPVSSLPQVEEVRREWRDRAWDALNDQTEVALEVERLLGASAFWDSSPDEAFGSSLRDLEKYGRIIPDEEVREYIRSCGDASVLQRQFEKYFAEEIIGSYCAAPESGEVGG